MRTMMTCSLVALNMLSAQNQLLTSCKRPVYGCLSTTTYILNLSLTLKKINKNKNKGGHEKVENLLTQLVFRPFEARPSLLDAR